MPLFLRQLTRREFLTRMALAGAAAALAPRALAADAAKPCAPNTFAFFSDTHIAADPAQQYLNVNMSDHFAACARELTGWPTRPAALIVNGDLAYLMGKPQDYATFARLIEPLRTLAPVHLTLGNHDDREQFWNAFPADATAQSSALHRQATIFPSEHANWFMLDTLDVTDATPGQLGQTQLDWLARELDARPEKPALIILHHNPQFLKVTTGLKDTAALMAVLAPRRHVKLVVFGHTHDWRTSEHESGIQLVNLPPTCYVFKPGRPSGWTHVTVEKDGAKFELRSLDPRHPEHGQVHQLNWRDSVG